MTIETTRRNTHRTFARLRWTCTALCLLLALLLSSCRNLPSSVPGPTAFTPEPSPVAAASRTRDYWPTEGWRTSSPEEQGVDSALLERMFEAIEEAAMIGKRANISIEILLSAYSPT